MEALFFALMEEKVVHKEALCFGQIKKIYF